MAKKQKKFCVQKPKGGGDCFSYDTKKDRIFAARLAADQAQKTPGSKISECIGNKCQHQATSASGSLLPIFIGVAGGIGILALVNKISSGTF